MHTHLLCFLSLAGKDFGRNRDGFIHFFLSASIYFVLMLVSKAGKRNSWQFLGRTEPSPIYWILSWGLFNTADCNSMGIDQRLIIFCAVLV